jgi:hypothetical protein
VLAVGSGLGIFLEVCEEFGIDAVGCDIDTGRRSLCQSETYSRVRLGTLDNVYADDIFDAVFA